jgi:archaellin
MVAVLVAAVLLAGCTGTSEVPKHPLATAAFQPGQVLQQIGDVTGRGVIPAGVPRGTIDTITFTIGLVPGVKSVNLDNLTIVYADALHTVTLTPVAGLLGDPPVGSWGITAFNNALGKPNHRLDFEKEAVITIHPKAAIVPDQVITIAVRPAEGPALTIRRVSPSTIMQGDNVLTKI